MSQIYAPNQSISYSQGNQSLDIIPSTGLVITSGANHLTINSTQLTNGTQTLLFSDIYTTVGKCDAITYPPDAPTTLNVTDTIIVKDSLGTNSTLIGANVIRLELVGDTHQTHLDNTHVHILDTATNDEMFLDHNSLILVQPTTTHQTELLGTMLDFQTPQNIVSCGHETYQSGSPGFEVYDLATGNNALLTYGGLTLTTTIATNALTSEYWSGPIRSEYTVMNANHYVLGSMTAASIYDKPQKNSNIYFNPSLQTLYSTTFSGNLTGTASIANTVNTNTYNLSGSCYIPFTSSTAGSGKALYVDDTTGPLSYVPSTSTLTASIFSGSLSGNATSATTATSSTNTLVTLNATGSSFYVPFCSGAGNQSLLYNNTGGLGGSALMYVPGSGNLYTTTFTGALSGNATSATTVSTISDNTAGSYYLPFVKTTALVTPNQQLYIDDTTIPLSYNPSTGVLTATNFTGSVTGTASLATTAANVNLATTLNLATFTLGTTLSIAGVESTSFKNSNIIFTGTTNTVSILTLTLTQINGEYYLGIYNGGSGNVTFNTGLGTNIRTTYSSSVNILPATYGLMKINVLTINALTVYVVSVTQLT